MWVKTKNVFLWYVNSLFIIWLCNAKLYLALCSILANTAAIAFVIRVAPLTFLAAGIVVPTKVVLAWWPASRSTYCQNRNDRKRKGRSGHWKVLIWFVFPQSNGSCLTRATLIHVISKSRTSIDRLYQTMLSKSGHALTIIWMTSLHLTNKNLIN